VLLGGAIALATGLALLGLTRTSYEVSADGTYTSGGAVITRGADAARAAAVALGVGGLVAVTTGAIRALRRWKIGGPSVLCARTPPARVRRRCRRRFAATMAGWAAIATATPAIYPNEAPARTDVGPWRQPWRSADRLAAVDRRGTGGTGAATPASPSGLPGRSRSTAVCPAIVRTPEDAAYVSTVGATRASRRLSPMR
jgi:hypothetical protein